MMTQQNGKVAMARSERRRLRWSDVQAVACIAAFVLTPLRSLAGDIADTGKGMVFLFHADPQFIEGLRRHGLLQNYGLRLHNTSFDRRPFREKWTNNPLLEDARRSGRFYYIDRVTGGMPFQNIDGIEELAAALKDDPHFLGFQVHEWGHAPMADYRRIQEVFVRQSVPITRESFAPYEARLEPPYFSNGGFEFYGKFYRPLQTLPDVNAYIDDFMHHMVRRTSGQVMAVNGYIQLYRSALQLGVKNVMAEIGNQVQLTALQIACVRGAATQCGKPFGVYYEPWGGSPFGCPCAIGWSPWFANRDAPDRQMAQYQIRAGLGSSASLHRRLLWFAWLSGATFVGEEWGAENYFGNWTDYPLTEYGRLTKEFIDATSRWSRPKPIVPAAIVLPPGTGGLDVQYITGEHEQVHRLVPPDETHRILRQFSKDLFASQPRRSGLDDYNLTPSPWIGCFDVITHGVGCATAVSPAKCATAVSAVEFPGGSPENSASAYPALIFLDEKQMAAAESGTARKVLYLGRAGDGQAVADAIRPHLRFQIEGEVGVAHATRGGTYLLGIFNNLGIMKTEGKEVANPSGTRAVTIIGPRDGIEPVVGGEHVTSAGVDRIELLLPAGSVTILAF